MKFAKMQGCGNDYIVIYEEGKCSQSRDNFSKKICDRHYGIGADGVLFVKKILIEDKICFAMEIYNEDGTRAQMCGNGIRCAAKYVYEKGYTKERKFMISCNGVWKNVEIIIGQEPSFIKVNMGMPDFRARKIPVLSEKEFVMNEVWPEISEQAGITCVSMGNPHAVIFVENVDYYDVEKTGRKIAYSHRFPEHTNVEFVEVSDKKTIKMRVWERGVGETLACGTGACAATVVSCINGLTGREVTVKLLGGKLFCEWNRTDQNVYMTGPAQFVFEGDISNY